MSDLRAIAMLTFVLLLPAAALAGDDDKDFSRRDFYLGVGGAYVSGVLATSDPSTIPDIGDLFYMTAGAGFQYRF